MKFTNLLEINFTYIRTRNSFVNVIKFMIKQRMVNLNGNSK